MLKGLLGTSLAGLFTGAYGGFVEPDLLMRVQKWALQPQGWPRGRTLRLVMVADLHAGWPNMSVERVKAAVDLANEQGGDMILLMGDYRASHRYQLDHVPITVSAPLLGQLKAPMGVHAILGNHDWWDALRTGPAKPPIQTQVSLEAAGITMLINRAVKLDGFWLAGLDSQTAMQTSRGHGKDWVGKADLPATLAQVTDQDPVILLAHEPDIFAQLPESDAQHQVALTLSGHTHGGQVRFGPFVPVVPSQFGSRYAYGCIHEDGRDLVVSGGLGCTKFPVRFGVPPEITVVDLS